MKPNLLHEGRRWFRQDDARFARSGFRYHLGCFLAQQAGEKALKGYLFTMGAEEVWGHSVRELCEDAEKFDVTWLALRRPASMLDKYYIPTRYPDALPGGIPADAFDQDDAERAINAASALGWTGFWRMSGMAIHTGVNVPASGGDSPIISSPFPVPNSPPTTSAAK